MTDEIDSTTSPAETAVSASHTYSLRMLSYVGGAALLAGVVVASLITAGLMGANAATEIQSLKDSNTSYSTALAGARTSADALQAQINASQAKALDVTAREAAVKKREDAVTALETGINASTIHGDGTFLVNKDIQSGTYKSSGSGSCYWARLRGTGGQLDDIIANNDGDGQAVVTIEPSDVAFKSSGCGSWTKVG